MQCCGSAQGSSFCELPDPGETNLNLHRFARLLAALALSWSVGSAAAWASPPPARGHAAPKAASNGHGASFQLDAGRFGTVYVYAPSGPPRRTVLFLSGDGGWNQGVVDMAIDLRDDGNLVAGVSVPYYFKKLNESRESCELVGPDLERLSRVVQQRAGLARYEYPYLVGYSSGASLVYAALQQTPKGIFLGGISLGFCADLELAKPLCGGNAFEATAKQKGHGIDMLPVAESNAPWVVLQGDIDQVCSPAEVASFTDRVHGATLVRLPHVGHGFSVPANWLPQFRSGLGSLPADRPAARPGEVGDLPLVEVRAQGPENDEFVVVITGDGGYAGMDQDLAAGFASVGRPTVVLNSLKYFWQAKSPEQVAHDVDRVVRHYLAAWKKSRVILVGYSMGADVLPFALNRMSADTRSAVSAAALIGISDSAVFEFHVTNWLGDPAGQPTAPELAKLEGLRVACVYGAQEQGSVCPRLSPERFRLIELPGGHHFGGDYRAVVRAVLKEAAPGAGER
jgi:type IV secretory pathway VirJ component